MKTIITIFTVNLGFTYRKLVAHAAFKSKHNSNHDDVIKRKHILRYWPFVRRIHRSPVNSPHKGQWRETLMFSLICAWTNDWVNHGNAGDLKRHRTHYDVTLMRMWNVSICTYVSVIRYAFVCFCVNVLCVVLSVGETDLLTSYAKYKSWILNLEYVGNASDNKTPFHFIRWNLRLLLYILYEFLEIGAF